MKSSLPSLLQGRTDRLSEQGPEDLPGGQSIGREAAPGASNNVSSVHKVWLRTDCGKSWGKESNAVYMHLAAKYSSFSKYVRRGSLEKNEARNKVL